MTKAELAQDITTQMGNDVTEQQASQMIDAFATAVRQQVAKGESVYLRGFGTFRPQERKEKTARNISKGTTMIIPAHTTPDFKPSSAFIDEVRKTAS